MRKISVDELVDLLNKDLKPKETIRLNARLDIRTPTYGHLLVYTGIFEIKGNAAESNYSFRLRADGGSIYLKREGAIQIHHAQWNGDPDKVIIPLSMAPETEAMIWLIKDIEY